MFTSVRRPPRLWRPCGQAVLRPADRQAQCCNSLNVKLMHAHLWLQALKEVETLRTQVSNYDADKMALSQGKARLSHSHKQVKNLEWENEVRTRPIPGCSGAVCNDSGAAVTHACCRPGHPDSPQSLPPWPPR